MTSSGARSDSSAATAYFKHVSDERIAERLRTMTSARQVCEDLLNDALEDGGSDNI